MRLRRRKKTSSPSAALAVLVGVLILASLVGSPAAGRPWRELRTSALFSEIARAELAQLVKAAGGQIFTSPAGQVVIRLDGAGALPQALTDWAHRHGLPLPLPTSGTAIGSAEAVFCAKDTPAAAAAMALGPALTGQVTLAERPAWRPFEQLTETPCLPVRILAEHLAGRSPPRPVDGLIG
jgi:hypothetical protein